MTTDAYFILQALRICYEAHAIQLDRDNKPHLFHCIRVAEKQATAERVVIALLHDVLEDSDIPITRLQAEFGEPIAAAVLALTRGKEEPWSSYIDRVCQNVDAMHVKISDISDNTRVERMDAKAAKRMPMYTEAYERITRELSGQ